ncbi:MAG: hypothetical protein ABII12_03200 [Planctomycetota bacterium]
MTLDTFLKLATPVLIMIVSAWIKAAIGRISDRQVRVERRLDYVEADLRAKVGDEEWIRESMRLRNSVEKQGETLARIEGKADATLQVATSVSRLAAAIEKAKET